MELPDPARLRLAQRYVRCADNLAVVGQGSYGVAYLAIDTLTQSTVVIKKQSMDNGRAGRELAAFHTLRAFPHPNVLRMLDTFEVGNQLHLVFEPASTDLWFRWTSPLGRTGLLEASSLRRSVGGALAGVSHLHAFNS